MCTTSPAEKTAVDAATVAMVGLPSGGAKGRCIPGPVPLLSNNYNQNSHLQAKHDGASSSSSHLPPSDVDAIKAKIVSHPHYSSLLAAFIDCQKARPPLLVKNLTTYF